MGARIQAELANRQVEGAERTIRHLGMTRPGELEYGEARRKAEDLRAKLREAQASAKAGSLLDLDRMPVMLDLTPPPLRDPLPEGEWVLHLTELEGWGWLAICGPVGGLEAVLAARLEVWGVMAEHEVSGRPTTGQTVRVPMRDEKAVWWAWAADQEGRLLTVAP